MRSVIFFIFVLLLIPNANAAERGHMKLLAVSDTENGQVGGIADLFLELKPGTGRVFLETFPLTRLDTQISTRFAKQIACDFADIDCSSYDFFYTITADSSIIAGPSAGAAISVLTFSLIANERLDDKVAITGTINSGGLIGPVGGLKAKIEAASKIGIKNVLIPTGESVDGFLIADNQSNASLENETLNIEELQKSLGIEIVEVSTLDEALYEFTGKRFREQKKDLAINEEYKDTMKLLATQLCSRSADLRGGTPVNNGTEKIRQNAINLSEKGKDSFDRNMYYSAASYCFGSNVEFNFLNLLSQNLSSKEIVRKVVQLRREIEDFDENIEKSRIVTITDLESYMVVKERLIEANDFLDLVMESVSNNDANLRNLAFAIERINSAHSWATFLENSGKEFQLNDDVIKNACRIKISEVEERLQYVQLYFPRNLDATRKELDYAYQDLQKGDHELCLFKASKAKANVDTILSVFGVRNQNVENVVGKKLNIVERNLVEETQKGVFPILGYSYFEYASSLKESDPFSALLYSGYALELSNLDIYFKNSKPETVKIQKNIYRKWLVVLFAGILIGIAAANVYHARKRTLKKKKARRKYKRKGNH